jgi:hypothetical protein
VSTKQPVCEFDDSPSLSAEVENKGSYISTPPMCLHRVERKKFAFYIYFIILAVVTTNNKLNNKFNNTNEKGATALLGVERNKFAFYIYFTITTIITT